MTPKSKDNQVQVTAEPTELAAFLLPLKVMGEIGVPLDPSSAAFTL